jgi:hypothetical protein
MIEHTTVPRPHHLLIEDDGLAEAIAYAEKPGRDYIVEQDNPPTSSELLKIGYAIGHAAANAEAQYMRSDDFYLLDLPGDPMPSRSISKNWLHAYKGYLPDDIVHPVRMEESPLIAEWAQIPGIKLIDGRPTVGAEDVVHIAREWQRQGGPKGSKEIGLNLWRTLRDRIDVDTEYIHGDPRREAYMLLNRIQFFDPDDAREAGDLGDRMDLYSLYAVMPDLLRLVNEGEAKFPRGIGKNGIKFAATLLERMLRLETPIQPSPSAEE